MSKVYVKKSSVHNLGVFSKQPIKEGEIVLIWRGKIINQSEVTSKLLEEDHLLQISKNEYVYLKSVQISAHVNHSCEPNCGLRGNTVLIAMRDIKTGEEITFDYSTNVFEEDWEMKCNCGSKSCRGIVKSYQFLPENLKKKYKNFTSKYILEANSN